MVAISLILWALNVGVDQLTNRDVFQVCLMCDFFSSNQVLPVPVAVSCTHSIKVTKKKKRLSSNKSQNRNLHILKNLSKMMCAEPVKSRSTISFNQHRGGAIGKEL